jgi:hypothetical protein
MRGRNGGGNNNSNNNNNNNRKGPNPLTRNYESNGPDVKIRGSAQQIAEKYATLARDAQSSGDRVMAENYLQHAEHYNRIIAAAQAQMPIQNTQNQRDGSEDDLDDERDEFDNPTGFGQGNAGQQNPGQGNYQPNPGQNAGGQYGNGNGDYAQPQPAALGSELGSGPQPVIEGMPAEVALNPEASEGSPSRERGFNGGNGHTEGRRNRRPRRGERARPEIGEGDEPAVAEGLVATLSRGGPVAKEPAPQEPGVEPQGDAAGPTLIDADN